MGKSSTSLTFIWGFVQGEISGKKREEIYNGFTEGLTPNSDCIFGISLQWSLYTSLTLNLQLHSPLSGISVNGNDSISCPQRVFTTDMYPVIT